MQHNLIDLGMPTLAFIFLMVLGIVVSPYFFIIVAAQLLAGAFKQRG